MAIDLTAHERDPGYVEPAGAPRPDAAPATDSPIEQDVLASVRSRLTDVPEEEVQRRVHEALVSLGPVRVTTYLPILVERRVRQELRATA